MRFIAINLAAAFLAVAGFAHAQDAPTAGDAKAGATVFKRCMACHNIGPDATNSVGPVLNGVVGRKAGTYPGYDYSAATKNSGLVWDEATLTNYLHSPRQVVPGTKMTFPGLKKDKEIADVIAYLKQYDAKGQSAPQP